MNLYLLHDDLPWWEDVRTLADLVPGRTDGAADPQEERSPVPVAQGAEGGPDAARARLFRRLVRDGLSDPWTALADALLFGASTAWDAARAPGVAAGLRRDVAVASALLGRALDRDASRAANDVGGEALAPELSDLAGAPPPAVAELAARLRAGEAPAALVDRVVRFRRERGGGPLGRYGAFRWDGRELHGVASPTTADSTRLRGLDRPLARLEANTLAFLNGGSAMHVLLYGPRGSGKSTAVRGLLARHAARGLRLVELPPDALTELPEVLAAVADRPERFVLFVDDLAFESGDAGYRPLKSLLEGSVAARPENVRLYATSNRRHLVQERLRERPDPLDDDVHAWDTQHERLALADRFGMLLTFPSADRRRYLDIVRHLATRDGLRDEDLEDRAERFAREGNGYSGRTAQQFVDAARAGLA